MKSATSQEIHNSPKVVTYLCFKTWTMTETSYRMSGKIFWGVQYRDVVIVDGSNERIDVFNVTVHDLREGDEYEELKSRLVDSALRDQRPWCNASEILDVDANGTVEFQDALLVIDTIDESGSRSLTGAPGTNSHYYDTDFDGNVFPIDALRVINFVNRTNSQSAIQQTLFAVADIGLSPDLFSDGDQSKQTDVPRLWAGTTDFTTSIEPSAEGAGSDITLITTNTSDVKHAFAREPLIAADNLDDLPVIPTAQLNSR